MFYASDDFSYFPAVIDDLMGITIEIATYTRGGFWMMPSFLLTEQKIVITGAPLLPIVLSILDKF